MLYFGKLQLMNKVTVLKIDRLIGITMYLLNRNVVSARELAEHFEVSVRTVVRDVAVLSAAGIPVSSSTGAAGGYSVMEGFKLDRQMINATDQSAIITALKGFCTAYNGSRYAGVLEKLSPVFYKQEQQQIFLDFGASGENGAIQETLKKLDDAIQNKTTVNIGYVNASGTASDRLVEPLALHYRWYAWYLLAFCTKKQDYRIFKLARIDRLEPANISFSREHADPEILLESAFSGTGRRIPDIVLQVKPSVKMQVCEYLNAEHMQTLENGDYIMRMDAYENERAWFAMLLSFGDAVKVLEPEEVKTGLIKTAENILSLYKE